MYKSLARIIRDMDSREARPSIEMPNVTVCRCHYIAIPHRQGMPRCAYDVRYAAEADGHDAGYGATIN